MKKRIRYIIQKRNLALSHMWKQKKHRYRHREYEYTDYYVGEIRFPCQYEKCTICGNEHPEDEDYFNERARSIKKKY